MVFDSDHICRLLKGEIEDGKAHVEDKSFMVDKTEPFLFNEESKLPLIGGDYTPLYLVKWDDTKPKTLDNVTNLGEFDIDTEEIDASTMQAILETDLFRGLFKMKPRGGGLGLTARRKTILLILLIGIVGVVVYYLWWFDMLPI